MGIYRRGRIWYLRTKQGGREVRLAVGPSKRQAELALGKVKTEMVEGRFIEPVKGHKLTFGELAERYLREHSAVRKNEKGRRNDGYLVKQLLPVFGSLRLTAITPERVTGYIMEERTKGLKPATINRRLVLLKHAFVMAKLWGIIRHNVVAEVKQLPEHNRRLRYLQPEEFRRLVEALPNYLRPIVELAGHTGMRLGEILGLRWEAVDLAQRVVRLAQTKNGDLRVVPLNEVMVETLRALMRERARRAEVHPYVFVNPTTRDRWQDVGRAFESAVNRARLEDFTFHDLRHTAASWLVMSGVDLLTVASILGHKDIRMTQRYSHLAPGHRRQAVELLGQALQRPGQVGDVAQGGSPGVEGGG
ncbi:MAG: site-specific integrase [Nitrospira sp.]|nr:site-specific integrase [Nitrospira sp.]